MISKKICSKCDIKKSVSDFYKDKSKKDGYQTVCKLCRREYAKDYYGEHKETIKANVAKWKTDNPERAKELKEKWRRDNPKDSKDYYALNPEKKKKASAKWRRDNPTREKETNKRWRKNNPSKVLARNAKRRATKQKATPPWLTSEHFKEIETFYTEAKALTESTGVEYHVDHIMPLNGENSCGLHVPWNLRVITAEENLKKGNKICY